MKEDKGKGGEYSKYPPPETKLGKPQRSKASLLLLSADGSVKKIFEEGIYCSFLPDLLDC